MIKEEVLYSNTGGIMKRTIISTVLVLFVLAAGISASVTPQGDMLEYQVVSLEASAWVVTANEVATGNVVKFRLPPSVFKGQTFDAELDNVQPGQKFVARAPRNARLNQLIMTHGLPGEDGRRRGVKRIRRMVIPGQQAAAMAWEILSVDPNRWVVTARNRHSKKTVKFKVDPNCFIGFRFLASLKGIGNGKGFSIVTPNAVPFSRCCTLLSK